jgi:voltage-gated potassium channel
MPPLDVPQPDRTDPDGTPRADPTRAPARKGGEGGRSLSSLGVRQRRRAIAWATLRIAGAWVVLLATFYVYPGRVGTAGGAAIKLAFGVVVLAAVVAVEVRAIVSAPLPEIRAVEALGVTLIVFLVVFAAIYLSLGQSPHPMFNMTLDHSRALSFVVTVFSTVGFGDIVPETDAVRLLVAAQMLLDLALIGAVARILVTAARRGVDRKG